MVDLKYIAQAVTGSVLGLALSLGPSFYCLTHPQAPKRAINYVLEIPQNIKSHISIYRHKKVPRPMKIVKHIKREIMDADGLTKVVDIDTLIDTILYFEEGVEPFVGAPEIAPATKEYVPPVAVEKVPPEEVKKRILSAHELYLASQGISRENMFIKELAVLKHIVDKYGDSRESVEFGSKSIDSCLNEHGIESNTSFKGKIIYNQGEFCIINEKDKPYAIPGGAGSSIKVPKMVKGMIVTEGNDLVAVILSGKPDFKKSLLAGIGTFTIDVFKKKEDEYNLKDITVYAGRISNNGNEWKGYLFGRKHDDNGPFKIMSSLSRAGKDIRGTEISEEEFGRACRPF